MYFIQQLNKKLSGWPDSALTVLLIIAAMVAIAVALKANPTTKAFVAAWMIAP